MKRRIALIVTFVMLLAFAFTVFAACDDRTECEKNGHKYDPDTGICSVCKLPDPNFKTPCEKNGHKYDENTGICSVCKQKDPEFKTECDKNGHEYVDGVCSVCNNSITSNNSNTDKQIVFVSSQGDKLQEVTSMAIEVFQAKYPGWTVKHNPVGGWDDVPTNVTNNLQVGEQPDLAYCYPDHVARYLQSEKVVDLSKYIYSKDSIKVGSTAAAAVGMDDKYIEDFDVAFWSEGFANMFANYAQYGYSDDAIFTLPLLKSTEVLFYNKTVLDREGIAVPTTWTELWAACKILHEKYPNCIPLAYDSEANWMITMCEQNGWGYTTTAGGDADHYIFNNAGVRRWLQDIQGYYIKDSYFTTRQMYGGQYTSKLFTTGVDNGAGGAVFCIGSTGGTNNQIPETFTAGVAHIPGSTDKDGNAKAISQGPSLVMFHSDKASNAEEKEYMTYLFIKELLDIEIQAAFSMVSGYNPVRLSTYTGVPDYVAWFTKREVPLVVDTVAIARDMSKKNEFFTSPAFIGSDTARSTVGDMIKTILEGTNVQQAVEKAIKDCGGKVS